jgi:ectoine hydroxylase-related dioxygenase (phytanoyl-CoA dioxygenase family)
MQLQEAIDHLELFGYCVLEDAIPAETADRMAKHYFELHDSLQGSIESETSERGFFFEVLKGEYYETLFGLLNLDELCWPCVTHPDVLAIARHFLGPTARMGEACSKRVMPGAPAGVLHADMGSEMPAVLLDTPILINTMWMITDFTVENGATLFMPFSHHARRRPPAYMKSTDKRLFPITGRRGSVVLWNGNVWHASGKNITSNEQRMGLNAAYYVSWYNFARENGHQPVLPQVFERMPTELQELNRHRVGRTRAEIFEFA